MSFLRARLLLVRRLHFLIRDTFSRVLLCNSRDIDNVDTYIYIIEKYKTIKLYLLYYDIVL